MEYLKREIMEEWEIELRQELNAELPEGYYQIGYPGFIAGTGKQGYINYKVAIAKFIQTIKRDNDDKK